MKVSPLYRARIRLQGEARVIDRPLKTTDKMVAEKRMAQLVTELERERAGLIAPRLERESAQFPLTKHQEDFIADLVALGRTKKYAKLVMGRFTRLSAECKWRYPGDISTNSFVSWRSTQTKLTPKTLNEYLNSGNALLNWMVRQGRVSFNPLRDVAHADVRGHQQHRRAFTEDELNRLLTAASPQRRLLYLAAAFTGLRAGELKQVIWGDLQLDCERPHIRVRALTAKNRKDAIIPLHPQLLQELLAIREPGTKPDSRAFYQHPHPDRIIRADMEKAGIERLDSTGRKLDFHALRYTFATRLAMCGVSQRLAQELMRHSDPRLTANIYTDATQLPTFDAIKVLPWQVSGTAQPATPAEPEPIEMRAEVMPEYTATALLFPFSASHSQTRTVVQSDSQYPANTSNNQGFRHVLTNFVRNGKSLKTSGRRDSNEHQNNSQNVIVEHLSSDVPSTMLQTALRGNLASNSKMVEVAGLEHVPQVANFQ